MKQGKTSISGLGMLFGVIVVALLFGNTVKGIVGTVMGSPVLLIIGIVILAIFLLN